MLSLLPFLLLLPVVASITTERETHFEVLQEIPHDTGSFTQGLTWDNDNGRLFESAGLYGESDVRQVDPTTGAILRKIEIDDKYFAEGMAIFTNAEGQLRLIQITWREQTGWIRDPDTLRCCKNSTTQQRRT